MGHAGAEFHGLLKILRQNGIGKSAAGGRVPDLLPGLSDQHQIPHLAVEGADPFLIRGLLIIATADQQRGAVHRLNSLDGRVRIGALGIVVIGNAVLLRHILNSVLHRRKFLHAAADGIHRHARVISHGSGSHGIFIIMASQDFQPVRGGDDLLPVPILQHNILSVQPDALGKLLQAGKIHRFCPEVFSKFPQRQILIIQHADLILSLIFRNQLLHPDIFLHGVVTVQVILRDVEDGADLRAEILDRFQLEAADLRHRHGVLRGFQSHRGIRGSDISHHIHLRQIIRHDLSQHGRGGGLSVGARHRQHPALSHLVSQLHFSPDGDILLTNPLYLREICGNSRTQHRQGNIRQHLWLKLPQAHAHAGAVLHLPPDRFRIQILVAVINHRARAHFL